MAFKVTQSKKKGRITNDIDNFTEEFKANRVGSEPLRQVKVPIKSNDFCENVPEFKFNKLKFEKRFCAGGKKGKKEKELFSYGQLFRVRSIIGTNFYQN